jgi:enhancing lycopene biosynthesis protein 2
MKPVGVVLSGCGVFDGSEIHEAVLTLLFLDRSNIPYQCLAPDMTQREVVNHLTGKPMEEKRNVLIEAARIARGNIKNTAEVSADDFSALIFPGGFGAAKNLCDFAYQGKDCAIEPSVLKLAKAMARAKKPLGFVCIAPVMAPKIFDGPVQVTIGNDTETAAAIEAMGGRHTQCPVEDIVVDRENKVVSTPAYMLAQSIKEAAAGIERLVAEVVAMART